MNVSASKVNDFLQCSMSFYLKNVLKLPDKTHPKTHQGSCVHNIVEFVLKPKREVMLKRILDQGFSFGHLPSLLRYTKIYGAIHNLDGFPIADIETMTTLAFKTIAPYIKRRDDGSIDYTSFASERRFELQIGPALCTGFIDFMVLYGDKRLIDFKTKGKRFTKAELPQLIQSFIYQLYMWETYGELVAMDYAMLRFPPTKLRPTYHIQTTQPPTEQHLAGLRSYIVCLFEAMNSVGMEEAYSNLCADTGFCDRVCSYRHGFDYIQIRKKTGELVGNYALDKAPHAKEDEVAETLHFSGCSRFNQT